MRGVIADRTRFRATALVQADLTLARLVRCDVDGKEREEHVHALFFVVSPVDQTGRHLRILAELSHQVQGAASGRAEPGDIARVRRDLGLVEEGTGANERKSLERDRYMKIVCPNCRRLVA